MTSRSRRKRGTDIARGVLVRWLEAAGIEKPVERFGRVQFLGDGLSYEAYASICLPPDGERRELVIRIPRVDAEQDLAVRAGREVKILEYLETLDLEIQLPSVLAVVDSRRGVSLVQERVHGIPLETRAPKNSLHDPWDIVADVATILHSVDPEPLRSIVPRYATRRAHALVQLESIEELDIPEAADAYQWATEHLPPETPGRLLHGDLLGPNLKVGIDEKTPVGVLDFEFSVIGDPAYDLSVVTGGVKRPFKVSRGLQHLVDAYEARTSAGVKIEEVQLHELAMLAQYYTEDAEDFGSDAAHTRHTRSRFVGLLKRVTGAR